MIASEIMTLRAGGRRSKKRDRGSSEPQPVEQTSEEPPAEAAASQEISAGDAAAAQPSGRTWGGRIKAGLVVTPISAIVVGLAFFVLPRTTGSFSIKPSVQPAREVAPVEPQLAATGGQSPAGGSSLVPGAGAATGASIVEDEAAGTDAAPATTEAASADSASAGVSTGAPQSAAPASPAEKTPAAAIEPFEVSPSTVTISTSNRTQVLSLSYSGVSPGDVLTAVASYHLITGDAATNLPIGTPVTVPGDVPDSFQYTSPPFDARQLEPLKGSQATLTITNLTKKETRSLTLLIQ